MLLVLLLANLGADPDPWGRIVFHHKISAKSPPFPLPEEGMVGGWGGEATSKENKNLDP